MSSIVYYITGHGFGHAVRSNQVIRSLRKARPDLRIQVRTSAPSWLFHDSVIYHPQSIDVGIRQLDSLSMGIAETLEACQALHRSFPRLIDQEVKFIKGERVKLVIGDIPPLCFEIAARASVPSVAITNFSWDVIYRAYLREYPDFLPLIEEIESFYRKATLALTLPYPCDMKIFPRREPVPWATRVSSLSKAQARTKFKLPASATIILLSFGGLGLERLPWEKLRRLREYFFVATGKADISNDNLLLLPDEQPQYEDLVRAVDAIVTKPGYGIVADAIAHRLPMLYTDRGDFPEYPRLVEAVRDCATAEFIPQSELLSGNIAPYLHSLLQKPPNWPAVPLNGAEVAADKVIKLLDNG
ncbi:MAG: glycosyltransferase family protein [Candidatus Binatia bacterium]|nr:glycosyltransferase family protein [Candidatus Binatia bacterium]